MKYLKNRKRYNVQLGHNNVLIKKYKNTKRHNNEAYAIHNINMYI